MRFRLVVLAVLVVAACGEDPMDADLNSTPAPARNSDGTSKRLPPGPPDEPSVTVVLPYDAFGPQSMAGTLIGQQWWSWEAGGSFEIDDSFDVRVVIYRDRTAEQVARTYPVVRNQSDYRYVERGEALRYLDAQIAELETLIGQDDELDWRPLRDRLAATRAAIVRALG
jgi:hypothetical protein